jgi:ATP-binding cassette subfamily F protein 3
MSKRRARRAAAKKAAAAAADTAITSSNVNTSEGETKSPSTTKVELPPSAPTSATTTSSTTSLPLPLASKHTTLEQVLTKMDPTLRDYAISAIADIEDVNMMEPPEVVQVLVEAVSAILISSEFCNSQKQAQEICRELATVVINNAEKIEEDSSNSLAWMQKQTLTVGYENLPTNTQDMSRFLMMGEQKKTNAEELGTMDDFLDQNSAQARKRQKQEKKEREALRKLRERVLAISQSIREKEEEAIRSLPSRLEARYVGDLSINNYTLSTPDGTVLANDCCIQLSQGRKYGLCGRNGIGKTTLLRAIASRDIPDFPVNLRCLHVSQEVHGDDNKTVLQTIIEADYELLVAKQEEERLSNDPNHDPSELQEVSARLDALEAGSAEARASTILSGLQFTKPMFHLNTSSLSGGWRMRVALARALYLRPDYLFLDEPTNHLDLEAVLWLQDFLIDCDLTLVIVSHDRNFLNQVCTDMLHFHHGVIDQYKGDFDTFEKSAREAARRQKKAFDAQQKKRDHMQAFVDKFRYNAKRASMAQSRIKALKRMELLDDVMSDPTFRFEFPDPQELQTPILAVNDLKFRYEGTKRWIFKKANFGLDLNSRIGLVGMNGVGKSTLLKLIIGQLRPTDGHVSRNVHLKFGVFTQHHEDSLDLALSAVRNIQLKFPEDNLLGLAGEERIRAHLGRFGVVGDLAGKAVALLSGGQKSRVSFAVISWKKPQMLILDEPTNHLDLETIDALSMAISMFKGGVVVVTHDQSFVDACCDTLWKVADGRITALENLDAYKKEVRAGMKLKGIGN